MIISGGSRSNWRFFSKHLTNEKDNTRVRVVELRGLAAETVLGGFREMDAVASGSRAKNFFYHNDINPAEQYELTAEQWQQSVDLLEKNLGLEGQPRMIIEHEKEGRTHRHVIWSRIDADTMTAISDSRNYAKHEKTARELEQIFGHDAVVNAVTRDTLEPRPERRPKNWETFRGHNSDIDPRAVKREVTELWRNSDTGTAFKAALEEKDYLLCKGDRRDFLIIDKDGDAHSLARRLSGVKAAELRKKMEDINPDDLPTYSEVKENKKPGSDDPNKPKRERREKSYRELQEARRMAELERDNMQKAKRADITPTQTAQEQNISNIREVAARQFGLTQDDTPLAARSAKDREAMMEREAAAMRRTYEANAAKELGTGSFKERAHYTMNRVKERAAEMWQTTKEKVADKWQDFIESRRQRSREDVDISR